MHLMLKQLDDIWNTNQISPHTCAKAGNGFLLNLIRSKLIRTGSLFLLHLPPLFLQFFPLLVTLLPWILFQCGNVSLLSLFLASQDVVWFISSLHLWLFGKVTFWVWLSSPSPFPVSLSHLVYICSSYHQYIAYLTISALENLLWEFYS